MQHEECRFCKSGNLIQFLDLGNHPPSDAFLREEDLDKPETSYPLNVNVCLNCGQVQLGYVVPPEILYRRNYPYESSTTQTGRIHFHGMAASLVKRFHLGSSDLVIDVGSNVGTLLEGFKKEGVRILGVDPATDMARIANESGIPTIPEFFGTAVVPRILKDHGQASLITGTNVFAHIHDLDDFVSAVDSLLLPGGALVIEAPHFLDLVKSLEYDTIYHEHLSYISVKPLEKFFKRHHLELFDVEKYPIHGGTIRFFAGRPGKHAISPNVARTIAEEDEQGIHSPERLAVFASEVAEQKRLLLELLTDLKKQGKKVIGVSAPAKGNTLLNYCGITPELLPYITEKARIKVGLYTPGTQIPVYDDSKLLEDEADYALILAWNFAEEIMANLQEFKNRGGKFIIPIPKPRIV